MVRGHDDSSLKFFESRDDLTQLVALYSVNLLLSISSIATTGVRPLAAASLMLRVVSEGGGASSG